MTGFTFEESQWVRPWVWVLVVVCGLGAIDAAMRAAPDNGAWVAGGAALVLVLLAGILVTFARLRVQVDAGGVRVAFGVFGGVITKTIAWDAIHGVRPVEYRPLWDAGGWGIRLGRFDGARTRYYTVHGSHGVLVETTGGQVIIGSDRSHDLANAIREARRDGGPAHAVHAQVGEPAHS
jgi:hypothetical protein